MGVGFGMFAGLVGLTLGSRERGARFDFELRRLGQDTDVLVIVGDEVDLEAGADFAVQLSVYIKKGHLTRSRTYPLSIPEILSIV